MKTRLLALGVAMIGVVVVFVLARQRGSPAAPVDGATTESKAPDPVRSDASLEPVATTPTDDDREPLDRRSAGVPPTRPLQLVVLEAESRAPVAGADVAIGDLDLFWQRVREQDAPDRPARAAIFAALAERFVTDADGRAELPWPGERHMIDVTHERGLWGRRVLSELPDGPFEMLVSFDRELRVQVLSAGERSPTEGVFVALRRRTSGGAFVPHSEKSGGDGVATFRHVQTVLGEHEGWHVRFGFPVRDGPEVPIDRQALPAGSLPLLLPDTGGLAMSVRDEEGRPVTAAVRLEITAFETAARQLEVWAVGRWSSREVDARGRTPIARLGLGLHLRVTAESSDAGSAHRPVQVDVEGPTRPGETVECDVVWRSESDPEAHYPVVIGRFVHADGSPWPEASVDAWPRIFPNPLAYTGKQTIHVADDGRFRLVLEHPCPPEGRRVYRLTCRSRLDLPGVEGRLDLSHTLPPGETDLGDVLLDLGALLVAGTVVDQDGAPLSEAQVSLCQLVQEEDREYWPHYECSGGYSVSEDGEFALRAIPGRALPKSRLAVSVTCPSFPGSRFVEVALGQRGVRIVLTRGGSLEGSVRLADDQAPGDIAIVLRSGGQTWSPEVADDGAFREDKLPAGTVRLVASLRTGSDVDRESSRVVVDDLAIVRGKTNRDPRIQGIEIRGTTTKLVIRVHDESGAPIARALVEVGVTRERTDSSGVVTLRPGALPTDLRVTRFGYRERRLEGVGQDRTVVLERGLQVRLVTDAKPIGKDPNYHLGFSLYHADDQGRQGSRVYAGDTQWDRMYFDADGEAVLPLPGPGTYLVVPRVYVANEDNLGRGGAVGLTPSPRIEVLELPEVQTFRIEIPQALVDATVQRFAR